MGVVIVKGEWVVLGVNLGHPIVTHWDFAMRLFPNYFGQYLFLMFSSESSTDYLQLMYKLFADIETNMLLLINLLNTVCQLTELLVQPHCVIIKL